MIGYVCCHSPQGECGLKYTHGTRRAQRDRKADAGENNARGGKNGNTISTGNQKGSSDKGGADPAEIVI